MDSTSSYIKFSVSCYLVHLRLASNRCSGVHFTYSFHKIIALVIISQDLEQLAAELRADIVHTVSKIGGHLSASLGVVELSIALHHVFNTPEDKIIWDVGHQVRNILLFYIRIEKKNCMQ